MIDIKRLFRGLLGTGITWGLGWAAIMMPIVMVVGVFDPDSIDPGEGPIRVGAIVGTVGFFSGIGFGLFMSVAERRRRIVDLSVGRAALWGALGSAALPLLTTMQNSVLLNTVPLGALFASATVALARRAERKAPELTTGAPAPEPGQNLARLPGPDAHTSVPITRSSRSKL